MEKGNLSINSENILPIIKKWLYSDLDIFIRELVSNAADAVAKLKKIVELGDAPHIPEDETYHIRIRADKEAQTITFEDNGIGMTADEIREYINQIAFSGATSFLQKYEEKLGANHDAIIGHFGLGFYSAFIVADRVQIDTLSYQEGAEAARWTCDGGIEYEMSASDRTTRGTTITLFVNPDQADFLEEYKLRGVLTKYCKFLPVPIFLGEPKDGESEKDGDDDNTAETSINDIAPLWLKPANECTDEDYKAFYRKVFADFNEPLFWIHLNMDYPTRLKGILYFPKLRNELEYVEGQVKLYNNQVFVADNIKEVIPEYLLLLKGVLDCPDLPLNVSRSFLQNDAQVQKMSGYISRKVADKLTGLFRKDREAYQGYWDDIALFIKYGCIKEKDFYEKVKPAMLYKTIGGEYRTLEEFLEQNKEKTGEKVFFVSNERQQAHYIALFKEQNLDAVLLTGQVDPPFLSYLESYEKDVKMFRIDAELSDALKSDEKEGRKAKKESKKQQESLEALFRAVTANEKLKVNVESLKSERISAMILLSEQARRMQEMQAQFGMPGGDMPNLFESDETLVLNANHSLVQTLADLTDDDTRKADADLIASHIFDLAMMGHKPLSNDQMLQFVERSNVILERVGK